MKILRRLVFIIACTIGIPLMLFGGLLSLALYLIAWVLGCEFEVEKLIYRFWQFAVDIPGAILGEPDM